MLILFIGFSIPSYMSLSSANSNFERADAQYSAAMLAEENGDMEAALDLKNYSLDMYTRGEEHMGTAIIFGGLGLLSLIGGIFFFKKSRKSVK